MQIEMPETRYIKLFLIESLRQHESELKDRKLKEYLRMAIRRAEMVLEKESENV